nr:chromate transporter [Lachnospiraceae bacterium]
MKEYMELFWVFLRIGGLTFGGGLSMLPMLKFELVEKKQWISEEELLDCYAIGQCTPGIIAVNTATYVGYKRKGIVGGVVSTLGMVVPSLLIITVIALFLEQFMDNKWLGHALKGVRAVVCALMLNTVVALAKKSFVSMFCVVWCALILVVAVCTNIPTILLVVLSGAAGILSVLYGERRKSR